ncbi:Alpha-N-acetylgalactosaminide alpha-2,6-sialyltransferase 1 [Saguinus oedipus]|uniref:alpha-N-acetylgalactosaminide alpha-2,6-sialyltransferase n=1 Tax=Saguinus oedipus TaxID=9490 RepID=A0ABQ9VRW9_SAGOE|nr:Alpha-N-acetylgalactosaminide alpha-2,6-sialyltransferase 1 [Saguinus oedipus]
MEPHLVPVVRKVVTHFPPVPQQQLLLASLPPGNVQCITCAVVGNGGILNNSRMGQEIDSHDYVFRLSGALIKGYEQDVGTRTSFYGFTAFSLTTSIHILGNRGFKNVPLGQHTGEAGEEACVQSESAVGTGSPSIRQESGGQSEQPEESKWAGEVRVGRPRPGPEGSAVGPLPVLDPQDVRYLHFLEGTRDYEWLEALLMNQTLMSNNLFWFRYSLPSCHPFIPG